MTDWTVRLLKGFIIGSGFILPGVSGGALAAVFGIYERMILFLSNITKDFRAHVAFFLPLGLGGLGGVFIFSTFLAFFFEHAEVHLIWFFIGCIAGTLPALWDQAGQRGRKPAHVWTLILSFAAIFAFLSYIARTAGTQPPLTTPTWLITGALIGLSTVIPGLSSASILIFLQIFAPMTAGISDMDLAVIIPIALGAVASVLLFARLMAALFKRAYAILFHAIIGFVLASTLLIIPLDHSYLSLSGLLCLLAAVLGAVLGMWLGKLEKR